jgi:hypothetical protein
MATPTNLLIIATLLTDRKWAWFKALLKVELTESDS